MISIAHAATDAAGQQAFYESPAFWVAVSFVIFVALLAKPVWKFATSALDKKIADIEASIEEATKLREEAQDILAGYKRKLAEAEKEAEDIVSQARDEALSLRNKMNENLEASVRRREKQAIDRIAQAETAATQEVKDMIADIALGAARQILANQVTGDKAESIIDESIKDLSDKLN